MREISCNQITDVIEKLFIQANKQLPEDVSIALKLAKQIETSQLALSVLDDILENIDNAKQTNLPLCQDTGMAVVFLEIGQDVHIAGGDLNTAINEGISRACTGGYLRASIVSDPLDRINTKDNTPAVVHISIVSGENIAITIAPKGFGSENMSKIYMLNPSATREDIIEKIIETVKLAGSNPCPPMVLGVGIGGNFETVALLSKKALLREIGSYNKKEIYKQLEIDIKNAANATNIGPQGFGGNTTVLGVAVEFAPTHIAGLPLAINVGCHVNRHLSQIL